MLPRPAAPLSAFAAALALALPARAADPLPSLPPARCVLDAARALDPAAYDRLESACEALDKSGAGQLAVAVVSTFGELDRDQYANELFARWRLGHAGRDDGLLVVLKAGPPGQRAIRVEVGYGLEGALPDGKVGALIDELAMPHLKEGRWGDGLVPLVDALIAAAQKENATGAVERRAVARRQLQAEEERALGVGAGLGLGWLAWLVTLLVFRVRRHLPGRASQVTGLGSLAAGAGVALALGGAARGPLVVFFAVLAGLGALAFWGVARHRCPQCGRWMGITSRTLRAATYSSSGLREITDQCTSCSHRRVRTETIARLTRTTSGGGSGGRSSGAGGGFSGGGGGRSGGGGAGRSF